MKYFIRAVVLFAVIMLPVAVSFSQEGSGGADNRKLETEEYDFANGLFSRGMYSMAIEGYKSFLEKYPQSEYRRDAAYRIADAYFLEEDYDAALRSFDEFQKQYPSSGSMYRKADLRKAQAYYLKGDHKDSEGILKGLSGSGEPEVAGPAKYYLSSIYFRQGDYTTSRENLESLLAGSDKGGYMSFAYMMLGDIDSALKDYVKAAEAYGKCFFSTGDAALAAQAAYRAGGAYYRAGDHEKAQLFYRKVIDNYAGSGVFDNAAIGLLSVVGEKGEHELVVKCAEEILPKVSGEGIKAQVLFLLGGSYFNQGLFSEAAKAYDEAFAKYPHTEFGLKSKLNECWALYKTDDLKNCLSGLDEYIAMAGTPSPGKDALSLDEALYLKARALAASGRREEAHVLYEKVIGEDKGSDFRRESLYEAGWSYDQAEDGAKAVEYFKRFIAEYPGDKRNPSLLLKAAQVSFKLGRYEDAENDYNEFLSGFENDPLKENALYQLGRLYVKTGEYDKGIKVFRDLLEEFPGSKLHAAATYWTGYCYQRQEKWGDAVGVYEQLISGDKNGDYYSRSIEAAAYCYFQRGQNEKAVEMYRGVMTGAPDYKLPEGVYKWVADFYLNNGRSEMSDETLRLLLKHYPSAEKEEDVMYMLGENCVRLNKPEEAITYFKRAVDTGVASPYLARAYLGLGRIYSSKGEYKRSLEFLDEGFKNQKDNLAGALVRFEMGNVRFLMGEYEEAAKNYMMVAILYDDEGLCSQALFQAGVSFEKAATPQKSVEVFKELIGRYPASALSEKAKNEVKRIEGER
ncbi:MAG: tetratricopeptide repeat protein [Candidatus Omnitrophota bacterium]